MTTVKITEILPNPTKIREDITIALGREASKLKKKSGGKNGLSGAETNRLLTLSKVLSTISAEIDKEQKADLIRRLSEPELIELFKSVLEDPNVKRLLGGNSAKSSSEASKAPSTG